MALQRKDLLGLKGVTAEEIKEILDTAAQVQAHIDTSEQKDAPSGGQVHCHPVLREQHPDPNEL